MLPIGERVRCNIVDARFHVHERILVRARMNYITLSIRPDGGKTIECEVESSMEWTWTM